MTSQRTGRPRESGGTPLSVRWSAADRAAGGQYESSDVITALWPVICINMASCSKPRHGSNYNPLYFSALVAAHFSQMSYNKCLFQWFCADSQSSLEHE
jgi:hypothetical protein